MSEDSLEPLVTQCPNCETRFRVTEAQLQIAQGRVRCGACLGVFDGTDYLSLDGEDYQADEEAADVDELLAELEVAPVPEAGVSKADSDPAADDLAQDADVDVPEMPEELLALEAEFLSELRSAQGEQAEPSEPAEVDTPTTPPTPPTPSGQEEPQPHVLQHERVLAEVPAYGGLTAQESASLEAGAELPEDESTAAQAVALLEAQAEPDVQEKKQQPEEGIEPEGKIKPEETVGAEKEIKPSESAAVARFTIPEPELPELEDTSESAPRRSWFTMVLIVLALVGLPAQVLWFQYESWVKDARFRPVYEQICTLAGCELPPMRDISKIVSKKSVIRVHPERSDARIVDVLLVNDADFAQPFPLIELMATSIRGQLVAGRRFKPEEYLQGEMAAADLMPPRTPVHVSLEIQDPGEDALNFEVRFR